MLRRCSAAHVAEVQGVLIRARALRAALADLYLIICRMADFRRLICRSHLVQGKCWRNAPDGGRHSPLECTAETSCALAQAWGRCGHGAAKTREQRERRRRPRRQPRPQWSAGSRQPSGKWFDPWQPHGKNEQDTRRDGRRRPTDARPLGNRQPKHAASASPGCADTARVHTAQL